MILFRSLLLDSTDNKIREAGGSGGGNLSQEEREKEEDVIERAKEDPEAFGILYDRYVDALYRYVYSRVSHHTHAEDVTAEVFHRALKGLGQYRDEGRPFASWLIGIARHVITDHFRHLGREQVGLMLEPNRGSDLSRVDLKSDLWCAVEELSVAHQQVIKLRFCQDLTFRQIGDNLGKSEEAAKMMLYRALKMFE